MNSKLVSTFDAEDITEELIEKLVDEKKSFIIKNINSSSLSFFVLNVEKMIELKGLKCRVYREYRIAIPMICFILSFILITGSLNESVTYMCFTPMFLSFALATVFLVHRLFTSNPDYEFKKSFKSNQLGVIRKNNLQNYAS